MTRYMEERSLAAVAIFVTAVAEVYGWSVPFNTARSGLVFAAGRPKKKAEGLLEQFREIMVVDSWDQ